LNPEFVRLLESLANGVVIADSTGAIVYSNEFLERMFGYEHGKLLGQRIEVLLPAELRDLHARHRTEYNAAPETRLMGAGRDLLGRRKDGSVFPVEVGLSPIRARRRPLVEPAQASPPESAVARAGNVVDGIGVGPQELQNHFHVAVFDQVTIPNPRCNLGENVQRTENGFVVLSDKVCALHKSVL